MGHEATILWLHLLLYKAINFSDLLTCSGNNEKAFCFLHATLSMYKAIDRLAICFISKYNECYYIISIY